ncbi:TonB-dependent receptor [Flavobacterium sp. K5-23]|uniref:TonB-dependent receptor n=1 Tax=Flavobacterium sp. K5-23 TaxID=2746225 RepID=UPI00200E1921|nr:TonB-dependent receptor [Flavobacterium sp. K5-23]UQD55771.1 carboxypeptidase-like regulatory domain-containing protein [Flavobacterium sp. K5-23]
MGKIIDKSIIVFILFFCLPCWSQNKFTGKIIDNNDNAVISASVILKDSIGKIVSYTYSDKFGKYSLTSDVKMGKLILFVNSMGFEPKNIDVFINKKNDDQVIDIGLTTKQLELKEVVIKTTRPITIEGDKITFDVKSFSQGNEQVVEDLLKKIPGLNVSSDGTIKVGNQEVEKVMIDGDDFFEKGYKIVTKNMPVSPIDKIELLKRYSNNKHLKGIENSEKVALNLVLKEDYKRQWFGNMQLGYGLVSNNRYEVRGNLMNFGKKSKYYFLTNLNNIGFDAVGDVDNLIRPVRQGEPASIGDNQSANALLGFGSDLPNLKPKRTNFNNTEMLSMNSIFTLSPKTKLKTLGFFNADENDFYRNSFQSISVNTTNFENTEDFIGSKKKIIGFGKLDLTYDISKTKTLVYVGKFNKNKKDNSSDLVFNGNLLNEKLKSNNQLFDQKIVFTNKFKENKVLLLSGRYINEKTPQIHSTNQFLYQDLFGQNANNSIQTSENKMQFAGFEAHLLDKKNNGDLLEIQFGNQLRIDNLRSGFQLRMDDYGIGEPVNYQNNLNYSSDNMYLSTKYRFKINKFSLITQANFHQLFNRLENLEIKKSQNPFFINPKLGVEWKMNDKNKVVSSYSYNTTNASILDVYDNYIQTGFRSFSKGTGDFNQLTASSVLFNYTYGNWGDKFFANTFLMYSQNHDFFSTNSIIAQNYLQSEKIVIKDRQFITASTDVDRYFKSISSNLKLSLGGSKSNYENSVNNSFLREVKNNSLNYGFELRSGFKGFFNYHIGSKWDYNEVKTTFTNSFTDNMSFLDLSFMMSEKINFQIQTERYYFGNLEKQNNKYYFMDLEGRYTVKENKLTFSLSGNNLFDTKSFRNYSISDISVSKTEYRLQPRYVMLKIEFRF